MLVDQGQLDEVNILKMISTFSQVEVGWLYVSYSLGVGVQWLCIYQVFIEEWQV